MDLIARGLNHAYGGRAVLKDVTLHVRSGEIVAVLGPSGCGKSTLLRILGGLERPLTGSVATRGSPAPNTLNPITYIFQDFALVPWLSVADNVALPLRHCRLSAAERRARVRSALTRVELDAFAAAYPKQLSGGMKQRVGIARAIVVEPAILLIDEPTSALDPRTSEVVIELLASLWDQTRFAAVYVTHRLEEALRISHRIVVLSGRPSQVGWVAEIRTPMHARSARHPEIQEMRAEIARITGQDAGAADASPERA